MTITVSEWIQAMEYEQSTADPAPYPDPPRTQCQTCSLYEAPDYSVGIMFPACCAVDEFQTDDQYAADTARYFEMAAKMQCPLWQDKTIPRAKKENPTRGAIYFELTPIDDEGK